MKQLQQYLQHYNKQNKYSLKKNTIKLAAPLEKRRRIINITYDENFRAKTFFGQSFQKILREKKRYLII